jgi:hypothetical protein
MKEGWVNPRVGVDGVEKRKIFPLLGVKPKRTSPEPVATSTDLLRKITKNFSQDGQYPRQDLNLALKYEEHYSTRQLACWSRYGAIFMSLHFVY